MADITLAADKEKCIMGAKQAARTVAPGKHKLSKARFERIEPKLRDELLAAQTQLRRPPSFSLALIVCGMSAGGRSETINELIEWLDPKFVSVHAFDMPDALDKRWPPMRRYWQTLPAHGRMTFYFAGWYGDYLHRASHAPHKLRQHEKRMVERIRQLESMLAADGVCVVKVYLDVDARTQRERLKRLTADKLTRWRVTAEDRWVARHHACVAKASRRCIEATDQPEAPWHWIDARDEEYRLMKVGEILRGALRALLAGPNEAAARPARSAKKTTNTAQVVARAARRRAHLHLQAVEAPGKAGRDAPGAMAEMDKDSYELQLGLLQGRVAHLVRRRAFRNHSLVLAFEGMDAAGKGGAIRRLTYALDARQYRVIPVSAPNAEERLHPYLWRFWRCVPQRGDIAIFDRSWYGRVLVERVRGLTPPADWQRAYAEIVEFETQLIEHGAIVAKFWLEVSKSEQLKRLKERQQDPLKRFKVDPEDWTNRRYYDAYGDAATEMIERTHSQHAPWSAIAADDKRRARIDVLRTICETLERAL